MDLRPLAQTDIPAVRQLFQIVFGYAISEERARWRYLCHDGDCIPGVAAWDGGAMAGCYMVLPTPLELGGQPVRGAQSMDTMVHPDYRGRNLFTILATETMALASERGIETLYGFPNDNSYPGFIRRLNWDHVGDISYYKRPLAVGTGAVNRISRLLISVATLRRSGGMAVHSDVQPGILSSLFNRAPADSSDARKCRVHKTERWLAWRYSRASGKDYRQVTWNVDEKPVAALVWRSEGSRLLICETAGDRRSLARLLAELSRSTSRPEDLIETLSSRPDAVAALKQAGYLRRSRQRLIVRAITTRILPANIHDFESWEIDGGDFDVF